MKTVCDWRALLLLISLVLALAPSAMRAQAADTLSGVDAIVTRANALGDNQKYDDAIKLLNDAIERYPTNARLYLALANWQETRGLSLAELDSITEGKAALREKLNRTPYAVIARELFETYGRAIMYATDVQEVRRRVNELMVNEYPVLLGDNGPLVLPGNPMPYTANLIDPQLPTEKRGACQWLVTTRPLPTSDRYSSDPKYRAEGTDNRDPRYSNWAEFSHMLLAYEYDRAQRTWQLKFRVMWQQAPGNKGEGRQRLAQQCALLLLRCSSLLRAYTTLTPRFTPDGAINVWLAEKGVAGGEAYNDSIYLHEIGTPRTTTEWIRELTHEYGHQTLPPTGGYVKPEWASNGILGERLFMRWLLLNRNPQKDPHLWVNSMVPQEITENRIDNLIRLFAAAGPESPVLSGTDRPAMEGFVGMALYLDITRGSDYLAMSLKGMKTPAFAGPQGFLEAIANQEAYYQGPDHPLVMLRTGGLPADIPLWVYLRKGTWRGELNYREEPPQKITIEVDGKVTKMEETKAFIAGGLNDGWHRIYVKMDGNPAPVLNTIKLVRQ